MAKTLTVQTILQVAATFADEQGQTTLPPLVGGFMTTNGTSADQADTHYQARRSVTNNATPDNLDLAGGSLYGYGPNGASTALTFAKITELLIINPSTTATLTVGGGTNGVVSWAVPLPPGAKLSLGSPAAAGAMPVTAGTGDILKIQSDSATAVEYDILISGRSV